MELSGGAHPEPSRATSQPSRPFNLLSRLYADPELGAIFGEVAGVSRWLEVESALAQAQGAAGVISQSAADEIVSAARIDNIDLNRLWRETATVGYPIFPLVRMISEAAGAEGAGRVHYGATTQDIMDTGLVLQLREAGYYLLRGVDRLGDALAALTRAHSETIMAGRTHGQQAVPTTFGVKCATFLDEVTRHRVRLARATAEVSVVSLFGAAGTSAALGSHATAVRAGLASRLSLDTTDIPWHVSRDRLVEFGLSCALLSGIVARFAREVVDLSRTEIGEVAEPRNLHRGASSTMPQKANPIWSEAVIGLAATAGSLAPALLRTLEAGHERAAGEWQIEWQVLPEIVVLSGSAMRVASEIAEGLIVEREVMRKNLEADSGNLMAEAFMMCLADELGRESAHDLVSEATLAARESGIPIRDALRERLPAASRNLVAELAPDDYLGQSKEICQGALQAWQDRATIPGEREGQMSANTLAGSHRRSTA